MKRGLVLIVLVVGVIVGFLSIRGAMPFMPIFGSSMEPTLQSGNLLVIEPIEAKDVKIGDIIVYSVPKLIRDYYNYPPVVAHRVIKINTELGLTFRTKGDNTGEDPFSIRPGDLRGTVGDQIPYLGLPLLFFQSQQGTIFIIVSLALLAIFLYGGEIDATRRRTQRAVFSPVIQESYRSNRVLTKKIEVNEQRMNATESALEKFAGAMAEYAQHMASHTSAIQGLSEASHELKRSSAQQNEVMMRLMENMGQLKPAAPETTVTRAERVVHELEKRTAETDNKEEASAAPAETAAVKPAPEADLSQQLPPGCNISRKALLKRIREAGLDKPQNQV
ncbi:signal peptidase I [Chloroflexota bacterium]